MFSLFLTLALGACKEKEEDNPDAGKTIECKLTKYSESLSGDSVQISYDAQGKVVNIAGVFSRSFISDPNIGKDNFSIKYNADNRIDSMFSLSGITYTADYNSMGELIRLNTYQSGINAIDYDMEYTDGNLSKLQINSIAGPVFRAIINYSQSNCTGISYENYDSNTDQWDKVLEVDSVTNTESLNPYAQHVLFQLLFFDPVSFGKHMIGEARFITVNNPPRIVYNSSTNNEHGYSARAELSDNASFTNTLLFEHQCQ